MPVRSTTTEPRLSRALPNKPSVNGRERPPSTAASTAHVEAGALHGVCTGPAPAMGLALLLDGAVVATTTVRPRGAFSFDLPPSALAGTLDVVALPSGVSILAKGITIPDQVEWLGWSVDNGVITGQFCRPGCSDRSPILVRAYAKGRLMLQTFATPASDPPGAFAFNGSVRSVLDPGETVTLHPCLNGAELDQPLTLTAQDIGVTGCLDASDNLEACGWAIDLAGPARRIDIELRLDGRPIATAAAAIPRADLRKLGISDGDSGFAIPFPLDLDRRQPISVHAFVAGTEIELTGSPYTLPAIPPVIGFFEVLEGPFAGGWAVNMFDSETPVPVEAVCDGEVIGSGLANLYRGDVEQSGMPTPWCGFRFLLERPLASLFDRDIELRVTGTEITLRASPRQISRNSNLIKFLTRSDTIPAPQQERLGRRMTHRTAATLISIVMPVYNTRREWLIEALNSVLLQWSDNWELIVIDDASTEPHIAELLALAALHDKRLRIMRSPENVGIPAAINLGLRAARGAYVAFLDHDDTIEPDAVYRLAMAAQTTGADFIYSDEAITTDDITSIVEVRARPAFSHDYYLSHPYFVHMVCVRTSLARQIQGWDERLPISADVDFVLRAIEQSNAVAHVPAVLYRWRTHASSAGHASREQVTATTKQLLARHLARSNLPATVSEGFRYNEYRLDWPDDGGEVLIIIPTRNRVDLLRTCIDSIEKTSGDPTGPANYRILVIDHESTDRKTIAYLKQLAGPHSVMPYSGDFNFARMNNLAVKTHGARAKHLLFLNNDVEAFEDGWLQRLRTLTSRPGIGAVGPLLLYGDKRVQHAGVIMAFSGAADHAMKFHDAYLGQGQRHPGYNCNLTTVRDYSAVTAACMMTRRDVFERVNGFDDSFVVGFNDTDLCLRIHDAGFKILYDGFTVLYHHESATRTESKSVDHPEDDIRLRNRWKRFFTQGDPFYSPLLAPRGTDHTLRQDGGCRGLNAVRVVQRPRSQDPIAASPIRKARNRPSNARALQDAGEVR